MGPILPPSDSHSRPAAKKYTYIWQCVSPVYSNLHRLLTNHRARVDTHPLHIAAVAARPVHTADAMPASYRKFWFDKGYPVAVLLNPPLLSPIWTLYSGIRAIAPWRTSMAALVQVLLYGVQKAPEGRERGMARHLVEPSPSTIVLTQNAYHHTSLKEPTFYSSVFLNHNCFNLLLGSRCYWKYFQSTLKVSVCFGWC